MQQEQTRVDEPEQQPPQLEADREAGTEQQTCEGLLDSFEQSVEIQAQHRPDRLKNPRTESVGTDRLGRVPSRLGPIGYAGSTQRADDARKDIPLGIYFGVSVGALNEH